MFYKKLSNLNACESLEPQNVTRQSKFKLNLTHGQIDSQANNKLELCKPFPRSPWIANPLQLKLQHKHTHTDLNTQVQRKHKSTNIKAKAKGT